VTRRSALVVSTACLVIGAGISVCAGPTGFDAPSGEIVVLRATRVALACLIGAALSAVGAALQALLRNPLADPFVLGVSGGAAVGAAVSQVLALTVGAGVAFVGLGAVAGAAVASALLVWCVRRGPVDGMASGAVLVGVVVNAFSWAVVSTVRVVLPANDAQALSTWLIGALTYPAPEALVAVCVVVAGGVGALVHAGPSLALLQGGDDDARRLGVLVERVALVVVAASTVLVGAAVAVTGVIGFVGLLVPHAARRALRVDVGDAVWAASLCGAGALAGLDGIARAAFALWGTELPVGAMCALLGAPALGVLLVRSAR
jgi:iron complex transport system permease protein